MNELNVLLIQPPDPPSKRIIRDHAGKFGIPVKTPKYLFSTLTIPPLDLAYAAAVLESQGHVPKIIDCAALNLDQGTVLEIVSKEEFELVVINTSLPSLEYDMPLAERIKELSPKSIVSVAGPFLSFDPAIALKRNDVDAVVLGEIDYAIAELSDVVASGSSFSQVKGIAFRENGRIVKTAERPLIEDLDKLPFPAHHLLPMRKYRYYDHFGNQPFFTVLTSRGCPYGCIYCPYPLGYGNKWRGRSPKNVIEEINRLVEGYRIKDILFRDQVFTFDEERTEELCDEIIENRLRFRWKCETRADKLTRPLIVKMKEAGCKGINIGVESGDPGILHSMGKPGLTVERIRDVFAETRKNSIETYAFFMIGFPGEGISEIENTLNLARTLDADHIQFSIVTPYPGTKLFEIAEKNNWIETKDWTLYTSNDKAVMRTDKLTSAEITRIFSDAQKELWSLKPRRFKSLFTRRNLKVLWHEPKYGLHRLVSMFLRGKNEKQKPFQNQKH